MRKLGVRESYFPKNIVIPFKKKSAKNTKIATEPFSNSVVKDKKTNPFGRYTQVTATVREYPPPSINGFHSADYIDSS